MSKFQIILLCVFGFFIVVAVLTFALYRGGGGSSETVVTIWGDFPAQDFNVLLNSTVFTQDRSVAIQYVEKRSETITSDFTEALATGSGPDLIIISQEDFYKEKDKLIAIPYKSVSEGDFKNTFIEEGELFLTSEGVYALPVSVDPVVLYYNRDLLSAAGQAKPISYWDELYSAALTLTKKDVAGNITQSVIALGETRNIKHFKEVLSLLMLQAGTPITGFTGEELRSLISSNFDLTVIPAEAALDFYTQFANPTKSYYSWNRTMPDSQTRFISGDSAYYLGFASELAILRSKSPTLNFSVAPVPQSRVSGKTLTFGKLKGIAISRGTRNPSGALTVALKLISKDSASAISTIMSLPPVRRDLLSLKPTGAVMPVFYDAALQSRGWLDPDSEGSKKIFETMIDSVIAGRSRTSEAVSKGSRELEALIDK